jgi:hypothetical protein
MTILPLTNNPFVELDNLRNKLETRIRRREEILEIVNQGNVAAGIQQAESERITLLDGQELSLRILQDQKRTLDDLQAQMKMARSAFDNINIEEKQVIINRALGMDYLQQADVALFELDMPKLNSLIVELDNLNLPDTTLQNWKNELQADEHWLIRLKDTASGFSAMVSEPLSSDWNNLHSCTQSLFRERTKLNDNMWQFLDRLSRDNPDSRLLAKCKWLDTTYRTGTLDSANKFNIQPDIDRLVNMFRETKPVKDIEEQLDAINNRIKGALADQAFNAVKPFVNIFLTSFTNHWLVLIHESQQTGETLGELSRNSESIISEKDLRKYINRLEQLIEDTDDAAFYLHAGGYKDLLERLGKKNSDYPNNERYSHVQGLIKRATIKEERGKRRFEQVWLLEQEVVVKDKSNDFSTQKNANEF